MSLTHHLPTHTPTLLTPPRRGGEERRQGEEVRQQELKAATLA